MDPSNYLSGSPGTVADSLTPLSPACPGPSTSVMSVSPGYTFATSVSQTCQDLMGELVFPDPEPCFRVITDEEQSGSSGEESKNMNWTSQIGASPSVYTYHGQNTHLTTGMPGTPAPQSLPLASPLGPTESGIPTSSTVPISSIASMTLSESDSQRISNQRSRFLRTTQLLTDTGLIAVTVKMGKILRENAAVEKELRQLQQDTRDFLTDVLNNPENARLRPFFQSKGYLSPQT